MRKRIFLPLQWFFWPLTLNLIGFNQPALAEKCPANGFFEIPNLGCYKVLTDKKVNFHDAYKACQKLDSHLVEIHSAAEQSQLKAQLQALGQNDSLWIGLHDIGRNGTYRWSYSTSDATFSAFGGEQPTKDINKEAIIMSPSLDYTWVETQYSALHFPLCETNEY